MDWKNRFSVRRKTERIFVDGLPKYITKKELKQLVSGLPKTIQNNPADKTRIRVKLPSK